jgi:hypothetical protein
MDNLLRLFLRFLLIPLGYFAAVIVGTLVILLGSWRLGEFAALSDPDVPPLVDFSCHQWRGLGLDRLAIVRRLRCLANPTERADVDHCCRAGRGVYLLGDRGLECRLLEAGVSPRAGAGFDVDSGKGILRPLGASCARTR